MTSARPPSGSNSVARTRTSVVLPAPFGPSSPKIAPSGTSRSTPASASVEPKLLVTPSTAMADVVKRQPYPGWGSRPRPTGAVMHRRHADGGSTRRTLGTADDGRRLPDVHRHGRDLGGDQ